jgi:thioesterase domain-containing protein
VNADTKTTPGRLFPISRRGRRPVCVLVPGAGGGLVPYLRLGGYLGQVYNVYTVRAAGLVPDEEPETSVSQMADAVLHELEPAGLVPEVLFGWSMGGTVAWEVAASLAERGHTPDLVLVDSSPFRLPPDPARDAATRDVIISMLGPRPDEHTVRRVATTFAAHVAALQEFETERRYKGRVQLLICGGDSDLADRAMAVRRWRQLAPNLRTGTLAADHFRVFDPEHLPELTELMGAFLGTRFEVPT